MRSTNDNPIDSLGTLGRKVEQPKPATPDPVRQFEQATDRPLISDQSKALESIAETLRKQLPVVVTDGQEADWEGLCLDPYFFAQL